MNTKTLAMILGSREIPENAVRDRDGNFAAIEQGCVKVTRDRSGKVLEIESANNQGLADLHGGSIEN